MRVAEFIKEHTYIETLYVYEHDSAEDAFLDYYIIPVLMNNNFNNLQSLSLAWGGGSIKEHTKPHDTHIPEKALMVVGTIVSLEQLSLSSGITHGWRHQWLVDHTKLRHSIRGLNRLKRLALIRDTYLIPMFPYDVEGYYSTQVVTAAERTDAETRKELDLDDTIQANDTLGMGGQNHEGDEVVKVWEKAHRNRMLTHAEAYAEVLPALE